MNNTSTTNQNGNSMDNVIYTVSSRYHVEYNYHGSEESCHFTTDDSWEFHSGHRKAGDAQAATDKAATVFPSLRVVDTRPGTE